MSQPAVETTVTETPAPKRSITLRVPPVKTIVVASLTAVGVVALAKAASNKLHQGEDSTEVIETSEV